METNSELREGRSRIRANSDKAQLPTSTQSKMYESGILRTTGPKGSNLVQTPPTLTQKRLTPLNTVHTWIAPAPPGICLVI